MSGLLEPGLSFGDAPLDPWLRVIRLVVDIIDSNERLSSMSLKGGCNWFLLAPFLSDVSLFAHLVLDFRGIQLPEMPSALLKADDEEEGAKLPRLKSLSLMNISGSDTWMLLILKECPRLKEIAFTQEEEYWVPSEETRAELARLLRGAENVVWYADEIRAKKSLGFRGEGCVDLSSRDLLFSSVCQECSDDPVAHSRPRGPVWRQAVRAAAILRGGIGAE